MPSSKFFRIAMLATLGGTALLAQGCTQLKSHQGYIGDQTLLTAVQAGVDNKQSVETTLGRPTFVSQFGGNDWYYFARDTKQLAFRNPRPTAQFVLRVSFDNGGNVVAVNQAGMENVANISPESDKTPTLGRNTSFFEELFGNIGAVGAGTGQGSTPNSPN